MQKSFNGVFNKEISNHYRAGQSVISWQIDAVELTFELIFAYKTYYLDVWQHSDQFAFYKCPLIKMYFYFYIYRTELLVEKSAFYKPLPLAQK